MRFYLSQQNSIHFHLRIRNSSDLFGKLSLPRICWLFIRWPQIHTAFSFHRSRRDRQRSFDQSHNSKNKKCKNLWLRQQTSWH